MAVTYTTNLNLSKPDDDEYGDVSVINGNMDTIDTAVGGKAEKGDAIKDLSVNGTTITATKANNSTFTITTQDTTYANATTSAAGLMSAADKTKLNGVATNANNYSLPLAANGTRGGVQLGYSTSGKNYAVAAASEKLYVNVPWTDHYAWSDITGKPANYPGGCTGTAGGVAWANVTGKPTVVSYMTKVVTNTGGNGIFTIPELAGHTILSVQVAYYSSAYEYANYTGHADGNTIYVKRGDGGTPYGTQTVFKLVIIYV